MPVSNQIITHHDLDEPGIVLDDLATTAPRGWFTFQLYASIAAPPPPTPKKRKRKRKRGGREGRPPKKSDTPIGLLQKMFGEQALDLAKERKLVWSGGQTKRGRDSVPPGRESMPYIWDRDDPQNFAMLPGELRELRKTLPTATSFNVLWLIHPPYMLEDLRRDARGLETPERHRKGEEERVFREYIRQAMRADPSWVPDYAQLAALFPDLAPRERPDGTRIKDRSWLLRLIVSEERRTLGLKPPPAPKSARTRLEEFHEDGSSLEDAIRTLKAEGYQITNSYARSVWRELSRVPSGDVLVPPGVPVEIVVEPGVGPVEVKAPPEMPITHRPSPRAEPVAIREPREVAPEASPETYARELLRRGATYEEVRNALREERGRIVPDGTLRRLATELRKADEIRPIGEAKSRSDVARALIREGLGYDDVERAMVARGEKPLSRGQLRAIKANLKG